MRCPLECDYLEEARRREEPPIADPATFPNSDIRVTEKFLHDNEKLLLYLSASLLEAALSTPNLVDSDLKDALDALVRTYRTRESGLYYESRPDNLLAASVVQAIQASVKDLRDDIAQKRGSSSVRDLDILGVLVFLQRMEIQQNNGRKLGRAFVDFLRSFFPRTGQTEAPVSLIV